MNTIVYIAGTGRSGSTLLASLLAALTGGDNIGECARYLFNQNMRARQLPCSCGESVEDCEFWQTRINQIDQHIIQSGTKSLRMRKVLLGSPIKQDIINAYSAVYQNLFTSLATKLLIDSSKNPANLAAIAEMKEYTIKVIHITRNPADTIDSWSKKKGYLKPRRRLSAALDWIMSNLAVGRVCNKYKLDSTHIKYEDLITHPERELSRIISFALDQEIRITVNNSLKLKHSHILAGNPDKSGHKNTIRINRSQPKVNPSRLTPIEELLTGPFKKRFGY